MIGASREAAKLLLLGANGQLALNTKRVLLEQSGVQLTLNLRRANRRNDRPLAGADRRRRRA